MAVYLSNRDGGRTDEQGHYRFQNNVWNGNVIGSGALVTENSPLGMSVLVNDGDFKVPYSNYGYTGWVDGAEEVTISTADPTNPRIDRIVLYVDRGEAPQTVNPNNPNIIKFAAVAGTPAAVPTRPNDAAVESAIGASNPYIDLADVTVGAGVTQITNSNIQDTRTLVSPVSGGYYELGRHTVTSPTNVMSVSFQNHKYLRITAKGSSAGTAIGMNIRFNNDTGANYSNRRGTNGGAAAGGTTLVSIPTADSDSTQFMAMSAETLAETGGSNKFTRYRFARAGGSGAANAPTITAGTGKWHSAADIVSVQVASLGDSYAVGAELIIEGHN